jgi:hypothetical protein
MTHGPRTGPNIFRPNPRANIFEGLRRDIVIDARRPTGIAMHLLENVCMKKPVVKLGAAHAQRILQILPRPSAKPVNRN